MIQMPKRVSFGGTSFPPAPSSRRVYIIIGSEEDGDVVKYESGWNLSRKYDIHNRVAQWKILVEFAKSLLYGNITP